MTANDHFRDVTKMIGKHHFRNVTKRFAGWRLNEEIKYEANEGQQDQMDWSNPR